MFWNVMVRIFASPSLQMKCSLLRRLYSGQTTGILPEHATMQEHYDTQPRMLPICNDEVKDTVPRTYLTVLYSNRQYVKYCGT